MKASKWEGFASTDLPPELRFFPSSILQNCHRQLPEIKKHVTRLACKHMSYVRFLQASQNANTGRWPFTGGQHIALTNTYLVETACLPVNTA